MELGFWNQLVSILQLGAVIGGLLIGAYFLWQSKSGATKDDAIKAYKDVINAYTLKIQEFETSLNEVRAENKDLQAQVNQLIGENKALRSVKPSLMFESTVTSILSEIKVLSTHQSNLRQDFVAHSEADDKRFEALLTAADNNTKILTGLCPQVVQ